MSALAVGLLAVVGGAPAAAEVGAGVRTTSQAAASRAHFLEYAPAPARPGVVCLIDSGVERNPDTRPALAGAEAVDPSWGTHDAFVDGISMGHELGHGTELVMLMAAPQNGWGMVGVAPTSVRVYVVRILAPGESEPTPAASSTPSTPAYNATPTSNRR